MTGNGESGDRRKVSPDHSFVMMGGIEFPMARESKELALARCQAILNSLPYAPPPSRGSMTPDEAMDRIMHSIMHNRAATPSNDPAAADTTEMDVDV
jgi:hypothetical protein